MCSACKASHYCSDQCQVVVVDAAVDVVVVVVVERRPTSCAQM